MIMCLVKEVLNKGNTKLSYKTLDNKRGFLCHLTIVHDVIFPYLKGFDLNLCKHYHKRDEEGWKLTYLEWIGMLEYKVENRKLSHDEMLKICNRVWGEISKNPPKTLEICNMFKWCLWTLEHLVKPWSPPIIHVQSKEKKVFIYNFVDALEKVT